MSIKSQTLSTWPTPQSPHAKSGNLQNPPVHAIKEIFKFDKVDTNLRPNWSEAVLSPTPPPTLPVDDVIHTVPNPFVRYGGREHCNSPVQVSAALDECEDHLMGVETRLKWKRLVV
jgi:hypothetical protein